MRKLQDVLTELGLDLTDWTLISAQGISDDGRTIVGTGYHNGGVEAWVAHIPEPATLTFLAASGVFLCMRRVKGAAPW
jgi:hypothetical protein